MKKYIILNDEKKDMYEDLKTKIEQAWDDRKLLEVAEYRDAIRAIIALLDKGSIRVSEPGDSGWKLNE